MAPGKPEAPYWLTAPCPKWCTREHSDFHAPKERIHRGDPPLAEIALHVMGRQGWPRPLAVVVSLEQGYREVSPLVRLGSGGKDGFLCTLDEAAQVAAALVEAVRLGESE